LPVGVSSASASISAVVLPSSRSIALLKTVSGVDASLWRG